MIEKRANLPQILHPYYVYILTFDITDRISFERRRPSTDWEIREMTPEIGSNDATNGTLPFKLRLRC